MNPNFPTFDEFFDALWKTADTPSPMAFPWQRELARRVIVKEGCWPQSMDPPTAAGKTAALDIAVFSLAASLTWPVRAPRRIFFVVDRRVVVDEAHERALELREKLCASTDGPLKQVADALRQIGGSSEPLEVAVLRGGMPQDNSWVSSPAQPTLIVTTVDQLGSRLLFRGYGVTDRMAPIHAALCANDSLVILDEAHLSEPFRQTLAAISRFSGGTWRAHSIVRPLQYVTMSATPGEAAEFRYQASYADDEQPSEVLRRRCEARKLASFVTVKVGAPKNKEEAESAAWLNKEPERQIHFSQSFARIATDVFATDSRVRVVGVVVNRVRTARQVFDLLQQHQKGAGEHQPAFDLVLFTGRSRPLDREALWHEFRAHLRAGRTRLLDDRPLIVVATQCIEAGANLDFDALVTEIASLDALRQRFGRLDRMGELGATCARIVAREDLVASTAEPDAVYGGALAATWKLLNDVLGEKPKKRQSSEETTHAVVDFGFTELLTAIKQAEIKIAEKEKCRLKKANAKATADKKQTEQELADTSTKFARSELAACFSPHRFAPTLLPAHLDLFCHTQPKPHPDPYVPGYLHGPEAGPPDVQVVWRADLPPSEPDNWDEIVSMLPPTSGEVLLMPVWAVQAWLAQVNESGQLADVEGTAGKEDESQRRTPVRRSRPALLWLGPPSRRADDESEGTRPVRGDEIPPGVTIVVPASYGGCDAYGWNPESKTVVRDWGDVSFSRQRNRVTLRINGSVLRSWLVANSNKTPGFESWLERVAGQLSSADEADVEEASPAETHQRCSTLLYALAETEGVPIPLRNLAATLRDNEAGFRVSPMPTGGVIVQELKRHTSSARSVEWLEDDDASHQTGHAVTLRRHTLDVLRWLRRFLRALGFSDVSIRLALRVAALLHDLGKVDRRFQRWLHGDPVRSAKGPLLAKSRYTELDRAARRRARETSGVPAGWRHELLSISFLADNSESLLKGLTESEAALVRHLIVTHHGYCRPLAPITHTNDETAAWLQHHNEDWRATGTHRWVALNSGLVDTFWQLNREFGWWGLPYLEALLRLADHAASAEIHLDS
jgi:CRISPR-associated endonuclease/helicase Cas3